MKNDNAVDCVPKSDSSLGLSCGPGLTKEEFAKRSDINDIIRRFEKTGMVDSVSSRQAFFADVSNVPDFRTSFNMVKAAQEMFMELPADVRRRFRNDPGALLDFVSDSKNRDEAVKLGLIEAPKAPVVAPVGLPQGVAGAVVPTPKA